MFLVRVYLAPSSIHGVGCFASDPIRKGELVWQFDPRIDRRIPRSEYSNFPPVVQEFLQRLTYIEVVEGVEYMVLCADHAKFVNHAQDPNLLDSPDGLCEYAAWDIAVGEELTCNYYDSDITAAEKLGAAGPIPEGEE
jgi:uncharacterized protein